MNRATVQEIECFLAVAEELNFSRAARRLHISQPPLSRRIQELERKLGAALFQRSTRAVSLTAAGNLYREEARGILVRLYNAREIVRRAGQGETERLRLAFVGALLDEGRSPCCVASAENNRNVRFIWRTSRRANRWRPGGR